MPQFSSRNPIPRGSALARARHAARQAVLGGMLVTLHGVASAQTGNAAYGIAWRSHWSWEPWVVACLSISAVLYAIGTTRLWAHAGAGRGVSVQQAGNFALGSLILVMALLSPIDSLGDKLFAAHMIQHELLMIAAAPLLVLGRPLAIWVWALPYAWRRSVGSFFHCAGWRIPWLLVTGPAMAWTLHALALWLWHIPALFDAGLNHKAIHILQHISFFGTALIFWWSVFGTTARRSSGLALLSIFTTMLHTGALGAILTLSRTPWYPGYAQTTFQFGVTPLQDQQIGGLVMWVPAGFVYIACGLGVAIGLLNRSPPRVHGDTEEAYSS